MLWSLVWHYSLVVRLMVEVILVAVSRPLAGDGDPRRLVELAVKTSSGKVKKHGWGHYLVVKRDDSKLNEWLVEAAEKFPSVLEHVVFTFAVDGVSRVTSHQLVRHRIASYTQESQRYSLIDDVDELFRVNEEVADRLVNNDVEGAAEILSKYFVIPSIWDWKDMWSYLNWLNGSLFLYAMLVRRGVEKEDARYVLPQAIKTRLLVTVNLRELLHMGCVRLRKEAQWEIREVIEKMFDKVYMELNIPIWKMKEAYCGGGDRW